jgi:hypothetical protein
MMKKAYARGGMQKKGYAAGGASMKKKMMSRGGKMPMNPATGKPTFVGDGIGKMAKGGASAMYKKGYAAGGAMMKKKMMAGGGATSDYDITQRMYGGAGKKRTGTATTTAKNKKPVVTKAMMSRAGVSTLRDFYNKMEVNPAGTGYKKRAKALQRVGAKKKSSDGRQTKSLQGKGSSQVARVSARNKNKPETRFERIKRLNKEAMAKTGGKSGRLKSS